MLAAIEANEGVIMGRVVLCTLVFGMLYRTLEDHSLYGFFAGGLLMLLLGAVLWRKQITPAGHVYTLPKQLELLVVGGVCVGMSNLPVFLALLVAFSIADRLSRALLRSSKPVRITVPYGFAIILPVLYPQLLNY